MPHISYSLSCISAIGFIFQLFWVQYTVYVIGGQLRAHCPPFSFTNSYSISTTLSLCLSQQFLAIWPHFPHTWYVLSPSPSLSISIAFGSLLEPIWVPPLLNIFPSPPPLYLPPVLYVICPPLPPYDPLPLGCAFPSGYAVFLPNILSSILLCLWFLSSLTILSCCSPMVVSSSSASASFLLILPFNPLLNSLIRGLLLWKPQTGKGFPCI